MEWKLGSYLNEINGKRGKIADMSCKTAKHASRMSKRNTFRKLPERVSSKHRFLSWWEVKIWTWCPCFASSTAASTINLSAPPMDHEDVLTSVSAVQITGIASATGEDLTSKLNSWCSSKIVLQWCIESGFLNDIMWKYPTNIFGANLNWKEISWLSPLSTERQKHRMLMNPHPTPKFLHSSTVQGRNQTTPCLSEKIEPTRNLN